MVILNLFKNANSYYLFLILPEISELENILQQSQTNYCVDIKCLTLAYHLLNMLYKQAILLTPMIFQEVDLINMSQNSYFFLDYEYYNEVVCSFKVIFLFILHFFRFSPNIYRK